MIGALAPVRTAFEVIRLPLFKNRFGPKVSVQLEAGSIPLITVVKKLVPLRQTFSS